MIRVRRTWIRVRTRVASVTAVPLPLQAPASRTLIVLKIVTVKPIFRNRLSLLTSHLALYQIGTIFQYVLMSKNHEGDQVLELLWTIGGRYGCIERDIRYSIELLLTMKYEECWNPKSARRNLESLIHYCSQKHPDHLRLVF